MDSDLIEETYAERTRLSTLLADLTNEQWSTASLCTGWRVREVVAHLTMPFRSSAPSLMAGMVRAGFSFNRFADRDARATTARMGDAELVALLRDNHRHPWQPPGGGAAGALSHDVIHGLDITEPLGLVGPPTERIAQVVRSAGPRNVRFFGVDLSGIRLIADDADAAIGDGETHSMPVKEMLLVVTGRRSLLDVTGPER